MKTTRLTFQSLFVIQLTASFISLENFIVDHEMMSDAFRNVAFGETEKQWDTYMYKLTELTIRNIWMSKTKCRQRLSLLIAKNSIILRIRKILQNITRAKFVNPRLIFHSNKIKNVKRNVSEPLGRTGTILLQEAGYLSGFVHYIQDLHSNYYYTWSFKSLPVFTYKYTFHNIYFSTYFLTKCNLGKILLINYLSIMKINFAYCGQYPDTAHYSISSKVDVIILAKVLTFYNISFSFMIIDSGAVHSLQDRQSNRFHIENTTLFFSSANFTMHKFYINCMKMDRVNLIFEYSAKNIYVVHDGPGFQSKILLPYVYFKRNSSSLYLKYLTSTFHCMIHAGLHSYQTTLDPIFKFTTLRQNPVNHIQLKLNKTRIFSLPGVLSSNKIKVVQIKAPEGFFVNVSIIYLNYKGLRISGCPFAGITFYRKKNNTYKDMLTLCNSHHGIYKTRYHYSEEPELTLVFYHYPKYAVMAVTLLLSITRCRPIHFGLYPAR